jgi:hypothetical protein
MMASRTAFMLAAVVGVASARSRENFDFGWRFVLGDLGFKPASLGLASTTPTLNASDGESVHGVRVFSPLYPSSHLLLFLSLHSLNDRTELNEIN